MFESLNISGKSFEELITLFFCDVKNDDDYYDVISYHLASDYISQLESMLNLLSSHRLRAAICGIGLTGSSASDEKIQTFLNHDDPLVVSASIDALMRTGVTQWERISSYLHNASPQVRGAALRFVKARLGEKSKLFLIKALEDCDSIVRQNALDELEGIITASELTLITPLLKDDDDDVRLAADTLIKSVL